MLTQCKNYATRSTYKTQEGNISTGLLGSTLDERMSQFLSLFLLRFLWLGSGDKRSKQSLTSSQFKFVKKSFGLYANKYDNYSYCCMLLLGSERACLFVDVFSLCTQLLQESI